MAGLLGAASIPFIGCVSLLSAMVLLILSYASPYWAEQGDRDFGLWKWTKCEPLGRAVNGEDDQEGCYSWDQTWDVDEWLEAVRGLESLAIIFWSIPLVVLPVYLYIALGLKYRTTMITMTVLTLLGALCNIAGVAVFAVKLDEKSSLDAGWCLFVCGIAFVPGQIAVIAFAVATVKMPKFETERHYMNGFFADPDRSRMYMVENFDQPKATPSEISPRNGASAGVDNPAMDGHGQ